MAAQEAVMTSDSLTQMEQVKKKKPRKFVMIVKGIDILQLVVFKKGQFNTQLQKALKNGPKGPGRYWGVVQGEGAEIAFRMSIDDGFAEDPCKIKTLKAFLKEWSGTPFKPRFEFVSQAELDAALRLTEIDDDADEGPGNAPTAASPAALGSQNATSLGVERDGKEPVGGETTSQISPEEEKRLAADEAEVVARAAAAERQAETEAKHNALQDSFDQLQPSLLAAAAAHPAEADDLHDLAGEFTESMKVNDLPIAEEWLRKLVEAIDALPKEAVSEVDPQQLELESTLKRLAPTAVPLAKAGDEFGQALASLLRAVQAERTAGEFAAGLRTAAQIEQMLAHRQPSSTSDADDANAFRQRVQSLMPRLREAVAAGDPTGLEVKRLAADAQVKARENAFREGHAILDQIEALLPRIASDPHQQLYEGLLATVPVDLGRLERRRADAAAPIAEMVQRAAQAAERRDFELGYQLLKEAAEAVAAAQSSAAAAEARDVSPAGIVASMRETLASAERRWSQGIADARAQLEPVKERVAEQFPDAAPAIDSIIESYWQDLLATIVENQGVADDHGVAAARQSVCSAVDAMRDEVTDDELFGYLAQCGVPIITVFDKVFDDIDGMLSA